MFPLITGDSTVLVGQGRIQSKDILTTTNSHRKTLSEAEIKTVINFWGEENRENYKNGLKVCAQEMNL